MRVAAADDYTDAQRAAWAPTNLDAVQRAAWASARASARTIVAVDNEAVVGFSDLVDGVVLDMLYVDPSYAGRGIGSALISAIIDLARSGGAAMLTTNASLIARPVFERHGFEVVARRSVVVRGVAMTNFQMRLDLDRN